MTKIIFMFTEFLYASIYLATADIIQDKFIESANPYVLMIYKICFPLVFGLIYGINQNISFKETKNKRINLLNCLFLVLNIGIVLFYWHQSYQLSAFNLILAGTYAADICKGILKNNQNLRFRA